MAAVSRITLSRLFCGRNVTVSRNIVRTILSDAYYCREKWAERLQTSILQKVNVDEFAVKMQEKFDREKLLGAVDIDILANKFELLSKKQMDFAQSLFYRFRHTNECLKTPESTHHALVRALLELEEYDRLWEILKDKINYGIFLDYYVANIMMDHFIKNQMYYEAASVAYDMMLQEDFAHPLCRLLAWYACHLRWRNPEPSDKELKEEEKEQEEEYDEEEEEKVIKVAFIENPWYDDHFDIPKEMQLLGKTLTMVTREENNLLGYSYMLIGWALYEKFEKGLELLEKCLHSHEDNTICQEALEEFQTRLENVETKEAPTEPKPPGVIKLEDLYPFITPEQKTQYLERFQALEEKLQSSGKAAKDFSLDEQLKKYVMETAQKQEEADINAQITMFEAWNKRREEMVDEQIRDYRRMLKKKEIEKKLEELREQELRLTFFDNRERIKLMMKRGKQIKELEELFQTEEYLHWSPRP